MKARTEIHQPLLSVCCLQETEVPKNYPVEVLNCNDYVLELEESMQKSRVGIYLRNDVIYQRRTDLEDTNCHIVVVDVSCEIKIRIINVYRTFRPPDGSSSTEFFLKQISVLKKALCKNCYIMGDFNLDGGMNIRPDYCNKLLLNCVELP